MRTAEERFWAKVEKTETCWNWIASKCQNGYGRFGLNGAIPYSHRVSYELAYGPIPEGLEVDHKCHNRACVNPCHLRLVTHQQNGENRNGAQANSKTGVRGVAWKKSSRKYEASVVLRGKRHYVGLFQSLADAETAVIARRNELLTHNDLDRAA